MLRAEGSSSFRRSPVSRCSRSQCSERTQLARNNNASNRNQHRKSNQSPHTEGTLTYRASVTASRRRESVTRQARLGKAPSTKVVEQLGMKTYTSAWALRLSWTLPSTRSARPPFLKPNPAPAHHFSKSTQPSGAHRIRLHRTRRSHRTGARQTLLDR